MEFVVEFYSSCSMGSYDRLYNQGIKLFLGQSHPPWMGPNTLYNDRYIDLKKELDIIDSFFRRFHFFSTFTLLCQ